MALYRSSSETVQKHSKANRSRAVTRFLHNSSWQAEDTCTNFFPPCNTYINKNNFVVILGRETRHILNACGTENTFDEKTCALHYSTAIHLNSMQGGWIWKKPWMEENVRCKQAILAFVLPHHSLRPMFTVFPVTYPQKSLQAFRQCFPHKYTIVLNNLQIHAYNIRKLNQTNSWGLHICNTGQICRVLEVCKCAILFFFLFKFVRLGCCCSLLLCVRFFIFLRLSFSQKGWGISIDLFSFFWGPKKDELWRSSCPNSA